MNELRPKDLPDHWRQQANQLEPYAPGVAQAFLRCADELAVAIAAWATEPISYAEGAAYSGYSTGHISRLVSEGIIPNVGEPNRPRVRRCDLPVKPGKGLPTGDLAERVLAGRG